MRPCPSTLCGALAIGLGVQAGAFPQAPALARSPAAINAEQCAVVLNDVKAGRDISINVKCDVPTESQILAQLMAAPFASECVFATPVKWAKLHPAASVELQAVPRSGSYFSQFDFRYIAYQSEATEIEKAFLFGGDVLLDGEPLSPWMKENHARLVRLRETNGGHIVPDHVMQRAQGFDAFTAKDAAADTRVRANIRYEDGSSVEPGRLFAFREDKLVAQVLVHPAPSPYPRLSDTVTTYTFRCEADLAMKPKTFADLCAGLIERTTLTQQFGARTCRHSGSGANRRYVYAPAQ